MPTGKRHEPTQPDTDNRSRQLNPEHDAYWQSRGESRPPTGATPPTPESKPERS